MKKQQDKETITQGNSVEAWWRHKLENRNTVPACAEVPISAKFRRKGDLWLAWKQQAAHDYLELSYYSYCAKQGLEALEEKNFHKTFLELFTDKYSPQILNKRCYGFREYLDRDPVHYEEYMMVLHYFLPSIYFCRALFELATGSEPIEWLDGRRMKESFKGSPEFWCELGQNRIYQDNFPQYGDREFTPEYVKIVHRSKL